MGSTCRPVSNTTGGAHVAHVSSTWRRHNQAGVVREVRMWLGTCEQSGIEVNQAGVIREASMRRGTCEQYRDGGHNDAGAARMRGAHAQPANVLERRARAHGCGGNG